MPNYFVSAIGTNSGKTIVSAILVQAFQADYWKPIQSGMEDRDTETVKSLIHNDYSIFYPEVYLLKKPASPHEAAFEEGITVDLQKFVLPDNSGNTLIIEGAGGLMVPLNDQDVVADLIPLLQAEVILVSNYYLGSINHTLLSIEYLKQKNIPIKGIVFNGVKNEHSKSIILKRTGLKCLLEVDQEEKWDQFTLSKYAIKLFENWNE
jgi:dethiobiotin synthetase